MTKQITPGILWVGIQDWDRRIFDSLITIPYGTSYNSYLVKGDSKTALIDTTNPGFEEEFLKGLAALAPLAALDYVVMNHAEPDHAGAIPQVLAAAPKAKLLLTQRGLAMAQSLYGVAEERVSVVKEGDTIDLGGKTLRFIEAPFLHWPETMFTFCPEDGVLFTCDFLGSHIASGLLYADQIGDIVLPEAKRYYAEIMMPFAPAAGRGLDKIAPLAPKVIAPSHGPVHRKPAVVLDAYERWVRGPLQPKVVVAYVSMWNSTAELAKAVAEGITAEGVEAIPHNLLMADISHVARDLVDAGALVVGSPTVLGGPHPLVAYAITLVRALRPRLKIAAAFGSYGWSGGAMKAIGEAAKSAGFEVIGAVDVKGRPQEADLIAARELGRSVAHAVLASTKPSS